ncbi:DUF4158 domain-containing protein [Massilia sp. DJPM01]|uniref:DUF4158 domain-containing protein n=1 Tax=Massilia sp. DJPM01 TaxID=3024404 RepID=UPI0035A3B923
MPRRSLLSDTERDGLLVLPQSQNDLIQQYSFTDADLALIRSRRGAANRLGFAVQMCLLRYPGYALASATLLVTVLHWIVKHLRSDVDFWPEYRARENSSNEHLHEQRACGPLEGITAASAETAPGSCAAGARSIPA